MLYAILLLLLPPQTQAPRPPQAPTPPQAPALSQSVKIEKVLTDAQKYAQAHQECLASGKPLVVWIGGDMCPLCVEASKGEFTHCILDSMEGVVSPAIMVGIPEDGSIWKAGLFQGWRADASSLGQHIATIRSTITDYRLRHRRSLAVPSIAPAPLVPVRQAPVQSPAVTPFPPRVRGIEGGMPLPRFTPMYRGRSGGGGGRSC